MLPIRIKIIIIIKKKWKIFENVQEKRATDDDFELGKLRDDSNNIIYFNFVVSLFAHENGHCTEYTYRFVVIYGC